MHTSTTTYTDSIQIFTRSVNPITNLTTGSSNTAIGMNSENSCTTGSSNDAIGNYALYNITTGSNNCGFGNNASAPSATSENTITLGKGSHSNLRCNDTTISSLSDERDKAQITDLPEAVGLDFINSLRPRTFYWDRREWYDNGIPDGSKIKPNFRSWKSNSGMKMGFIAQEVDSKITGEKCLEDSGMVTKDNPDKLEFAPAHLITPLVKAVQQLTKRIEELEAK